MAVAKYILYILYIISCIQFGSDYSENQYLWHLVLVIAKNN